MLRDVGGLAMGGGRAENGGCSPQRSRGSGGAIPARIVPMTGGRPVPGPMAVSLVRRICAPFLRGLRDPPLPAAGSRRGRRSHKNSRGLTTKSSSAEKAATQDACKRGLSAPPKPEKALACTKTRRGLNRAAQPTAVGEQRREGRNAGFVQARAFCTERNWWQTVPATPRHTRPLLRLLPSGPDRVHNVALRGDQHGRH